MAEQFQNFFVTKLREACDATATTIYVETVPSITEGTLVLEYANSTKHEIIHFTGVSGYGLTGCTRGLEGTTAQSHSAGTDVRQNLTAGMIDKLINGVITTENIADGAVTADKIDFTTLWPVGSYYETSDLTFDPNVSWGGTWVQDSKGRATFSYDSTVTEFNTVGKTGGSLVHHHSFKGLTNTNVTSGAGVIGTDNFTNNTSTLPQYVVVIRWHRIA